MATAGTMYGMSRKTTIYLPDEMKKAIESEAIRRKCSEAQVIRDAVSAAIARPLPSAGLLTGEAIAERADEFLSGFGDR